MHQSFVRRGETTNVGVGSLNGAFFASDEAWVR